jgi:hypothetical protein
LAGLSKLGKDELADAADKTYVSRAFLLPVPGRSCYKHGGRYFRWNPLPPNEIAETAKAPEGTESPVSANTDLCTRSTLMKEIPATL